MIVDRKMADLTVSKLSGLVGSILTFRGWPYQNENELKINAESMGDFHDLIMKDILTFPVTVKADELPPKPSFYGIEIMISDEVPKGEIWLINTFIPARVRFKFSEDQ